MFSLQDMQRFMRPIKNHIYGIVGRAILTAVNNSTKTQIVQIKAFGEEIFELERLQEYGFENYPDVAGDENNEIIYLAIGGNRSLATVIRTHNRELRPKTLTAGEVMVYCKYGQKIHLKADGSILIDAGTNDITLTGNVNLKATGGNAVMLDTMINKYNGHKHVETGGTTQVPDTLLVAGTDSAENVKAKTG